jgi:hypothetical protein
MRLDLGVRKCAQIPGFGGTMFSFGCERPSLLAGGGIHGIKVAVETDHIDGAVHNRWRRVHSAVGVELPSEFSGGGIDGIEVSVSASEVNHTVGHSG